ncbi:carboxypeptidase-like regulatory domain-containing protein, partial [Calditrichota bacterium]
MRKLYTILTLIFTLILCMSLYAGTTGKVAGRITDTESGEPLAGVNVYLQGTSLGAATDADGFYYIINVPPSNYSLTVSYVGYAEYTVTGVGVNTDLTTNIDVKLSSEIMVTEAVVVVAEKEIIQMDVAGSQVSMSSEEIEALPVTSVEQAVGFQAGITSDLEVRGSGADEVLFVVDGVGLRDTRRNNPITGIPLSALQEISVQAGGVNAEFGNARAGVVNVVTKEGDPNRYTGTVSYKISPAHAKHFGISPYDKMSFWNRAYFDPDVMWTGTDNGAWDKYTQRQYREFGGWNEVSAATLQDDDPSNDLTPEAAKRLFEWENRKQGDIKDPDYNFDGGFGGPVPFLSKDLGNLRFFASYRREKNHYLVSLATDALIQDTYMLRLTSDISPSMKLSFLGLYGETHGTSSSTSGYSDIFKSTGDVAEVMDRTGFTVPWRLYTDLYYSKTARYTHTLSAKLTNVVSPSTFWEAKLTKTGQNYVTGPGPYRDLAKKYQIVPGYIVDEAPLGYFRDAHPSQEGRIAMGGAVSTGRDSSEISTISASFNLTSQLNKNNLVKMGIELALDDFDMQFGLVNYFLPEGNTWSSMRHTPFRGSIFIQDKLEYEGLVATLGLILDYFNSRSDWYEVSDFDPAFFSANFNENDPNAEDPFLTKEPAERFTISPRLAISHPITENSKL